MTCSAVYKPGAQYSNEEGDCSGGVAMGFKTAKAPAIFLARLRGNHIKIVETWQAANIITLTFYLSFSLLSRPVSHAHICFHFSSSPGMKGTQLDDVKRANA